MRFQESKADLIRTYVKLTCIVKQINSAKVRQSSHDKDNTQNQTKLIHSLFCTLWISRRVSCINYIENFAQAKWN